MQLDDEFERTNCRVRKAPQKRQHIAPAVFRWDEVNVAIQRSQAPREKGFQTIEIGNEQREIGRQLGEAVEYLVRDIGIENVKTHGHR